MHSCVLGLFDGSSEAGSSEAEAMFILFIYFTFCYVEIARSAQKDP